MNRYERTDLHLGMNTLKAKDFMCVGYKNLQVTNSMSDHLSFNILVKKGLQKYNSK